MSASSQAQQLLREGRIAESEQLYVEILKTSPDDAEALNVIALSALRRRDFARAGDLLRRAVDAHPKDFHSRYHLGRCRDESGDLAQAIDEYRKALAIEPRAYTARLYLASALDRSGESRRSLPAYINALSQAPREGRWRRRDTRRR